MSKDLENIHLFYPVMLMYPSKNHNVMNDCMYPEPFKYIKGLLDLAQHVLYREEALRV